MTNLEIGINASNWHKEVFQQYIIYSPNLDLIVYLKPQLAKLQSFDYNKLGFNYFYKAFACVIINSHTQEIFLARDHFGFEPFYYTIIPGQTTHLCFGSNLPDILAKRHNTAQDKQLIANQLIDICQNRGQYTDQTYYKEVFRVTPGHVLVLHGSTKLIKERHAFWVLKPGSPQIRYDTDADYDAHFASLLHEAVQNCCLQESAKLGLEFSGGLDTSVILTAMHAQKIKAELFMHIGEVEEERHYGEQLLQQLNDSYPLHYVDAEDFDVMAVLDQCKQWFAGGSPYLFFMFAHNIHQAVQQKGCTVLLSGFGGDECVSSHAPLRVYGAEMGYKAAWRELQYNNNKRSAVYQSLYALALSNPSLMSVLKYIQSRKSPIRQKQTTVIYKCHHSFQERYQDWLQGPLSNHVRMRVEYSAVVARHMGFSYQYPLLYPPLLEFCFNLPAEQKRRQGQNRLLVRRYLDKHLPSGLFNKHKKCGEILPGTIPKCQDLYKKRALDFQNQDLPYAEVYDYLQTNQLITEDRLYHLDLMRYMFNEDGY